MKKITVFLCAMLLVLGGVTAAGATFYENYTGYQFVGEGESFSFEFDFEAAIGDGLLQSAYIQIGVYSVDFAWENANIEFTTSGTDFTLFDGWFNLNSYNGPSATGIFKLTGTALDLFGANPLGLITIAANPTWCNINDFAITEVGIGGSTTPVPEPATMLLFGVGLIGIAGLGRRKLIKK